MHTLPIELVQHTPILHFQSDLAGDGATLRATELKPKLDRYLNAKYKDKILADWKIKDPDALNYKLKIMPSRPSIVDNNTKPPMFFGQGKKPVLQKREQDTLTIQIFCLIPGLSELLQSVDWKDFFLATNFGTRQSKGYGSFFPVTTLGIFAPKDMIGKEIITGKSVTYRVDSYFTTLTPTWEGVMNEINDVYKCLRSGINEGGIYFKSLMFAYAKSKGQWWDKRIIKELFFPDKLDEQRNEHKKWTEPDPLEEYPQVKPNDKGIYPMYRDNLGLATVEYWKEYGFKVKKKGQEDIERFKSPILFKPLRINDQWYVFILHREIPQKFKNATFTVRKDKTLRFQTQNEFSMKAFLNYVFTSIEDYGIYLSKSNNQDRSNTILENLKEIKNHFKEIE